MRLDLRCLLGKLLDLRVHQRLLLFDEEKRLVLVELDVVVLTDLDDESFEVGGLSLDVEFFAHVDSRLERLQLLLAKHLYRVPELQVLPKLLVHGISRLVILFKLWLQLLLSEVLVLVDFRVCLAVWEKWQILCRVIGLSLFQQSF